MNFGKFFNAILVFSLVFVIHSKVYAQQVNNDSLLSVKIHIVGEGTPEYREKEKKSFFTMATVTNNQDTAVSFWIMSCSWAINWVHDNDSVFLTSGVECDKNFPVLIKLLPHKSINFYTTLVCLNQDELANKYVRLGFLYYGPKESSGDFFRAKLKSDEVPKYWSNRVKLENNLGRYEVE